MRRVCCVIAAIFVAASVAASDRIPPEVAHGRDLGSYENGGVYRTPIGRPEVAGVSEARRFVWTHWTQKRRGYLTLVLQGKDAGADSYIFIEPSPIGWHIAWRTRHYQALPNAPVYPVKDLRDIVRVTRRGEQLLFRDAEGAIVTKL